MKRLILACGMALLAIGIAIFQAFYINNICDELLLKLDMNYTTTELRQYTDDWKNKTHILNLFISHNHGEEILKNLEEMIEMIEYGNYEHLQYTETNTKEQLKVLKESEHLTLDNIL